MSFLFPKAPKAPAPPDPVATAAAQTASNRETAIANRDLAQVNQVTPQGSLTYTYGDPGPSGVATSTATQTLSPGEQGIYDRDVQTRTQLGDLANSQLGQVQQSLGAPFNINTIPGLPARVTQIGQSQGGPTAPPPSAGPAMSDQAKREMAVDVLYRNYLGRAPTAADKAYWTGAEQGDLSAIEENIRRNANLTPRLDTAGAAIGPLYSDKIFEGNELTGGGYTAGLFSGVIPPAYLRPGTPEYAAANQSAAPQPGGGGGGGGGGMASTPDGLARSASATRPVGYDLAATPDLIRSASAARPVGYDLDFTNLGDPNIERQRVETALMDRLNPYLDRDRAALETRLANQGIALGSEAYTRGIDESNRAANDARLGVIAEGGREQSRLFGLGLDQANFRNAAQAQEFGQSLANAGLNNAAIGQQFGQDVERGNFYNAAQGLEFGQSLANAGLNNAAIGQQFGQDVTRATFANTQRQNAIAEALLQRQTPLNEITALASGSQVNTPQFVNTPVSTQQPTDVTSPIYANYQGALNNYNQRLGQQQALMGGLFGLGGTLGGAAILRR